MVSRAKRVKSLASSHLIPLHRSKRSKQPKWSASETTAADSDTTLHSAGSSTTPTGLNYAMLYSLMQFLQEGSQGRGEEFRGSS
ncbi:hypothetical protein BHE74_00026438 [Ensete ventricosum]|nr:hypothetical protein GW17_00033355 [Ensete ventricosum]RWW66205.1 hypothetical protein BHE74_00026438 [Ensete ventricosum]RZR91746.1 hypothetical protein BHM03_00019927 [Ensete ventricosum]